MMTDNEQFESFKRSVLKSLPHLPLHPETKHVSQEQVDKILDHLVEHYPEIIFKIYDSESDMSYAEAMVPVQKNVSKLIEVPEDNFGFIDLCFELMRRYKSAYQSRSLEIMGKPLSTSEKGAFPEKLESMAITDRALDSGFDQELVDELIDQYYRENKKRCCLCVEAYRRYLSSPDFVSAQVVEYSYFEKVVYEKTQNPDLVKHRNILVAEARRRLEKTCSIPDFTGGDFYSRGEK